ncbi:MAG TPA: thioredoxin domain-containing protein [Holophagaceae bacterium]|jgi:protein-disulfide isomerase|nr:thioredoxin domain-containing protein [Holophagaceae bacterium]
MKTLLQALVLPLALLAPVAAQTPSKPASMEEQIESLKQGQAQMMRELQEIKAILKSQANSAPAVHGQPQAHVVANVAGEPFRGDTKARVAIMEYSDFDCPYCGRYARELYPKLDAAYVKTGKIKYFFRDLPLEEHPQAGFKANLARVAGEQGKFWEAHDWLFAHQTPMDAKGEDVFAKELGLDRAKLGTAAEDGKYNPILQASMNSARHMQITGTPAFLIGTLSEDGRVFTADKVFMGAQSYDAFKATLDDLLAPTAAPKPTSVAAVKPAVTEDAASTCGS